MSIFDFLRRKKEIQQNEKYNHPGYTRIPGEEYQEQILAEEIEKFFPDNGWWTRGCFSRSKELSKSNMPCHLRDNNWLANYLQDILLDKGIYITVPVIRNFMEKSPRFEELRHNYELEIVRWQIDWMRHDGDGWLIPKGYDDFSLMLSSDAVEIFRGGVVKTLTAIGMDEEVIEEGIEKNAHLFREKYIRQGFSNEYDPIYYYHLPIPINEEHRENWLKAKRYEYYCKHKKSVDKYGTPHPDMLMKPEEVKELYDVLPAQNAAMRKLIQEFVSGMHSESTEKNLENDIKEETLIK